MDFEFGATADALRAELRSLIASEIPADFLGAFTDNPDDLEIAQRFCARLASEQLLTLTWPVEYGGRGGVGLGPDRRARGDVGAPRATRRAVHGAQLGGPGDHGLRHRRAEGLLPRPPSPPGTVIWCQGFSEPDAGSDLAALSTKADRGRRRLADQRSEDLDVVRGDGAVLRPRRDVGRHERAEARGHHAVPRARWTRRASPCSRSAAHSGPHHLNEVFFDDVVVDDGTVLGGVGHGWQVIRHALTFERVGIARYARCDRLLSALEAELGSASTTSRTRCAPRGCAALVAVRVARLLAYRVVHLQAEGTPADTAASVARIAVTQADQLVAEALFQALDSGSLRDKASGAVLHGAVEDHYRYAQAATVASGTIEIQRMIVGRSTVGRP